MKEVIGRRRDHERQDIDSACGLPGYGDIVRVTAESLDVVPDPLERLDQVKRAEIARIIRLAAGLAAPQRRVRDLRFIRRSWRTDIRS